MDKDTRIIKTINVVVHGYGQLDMEIVWTTLTDDIPELYQKCLSLYDPAKL